MGEVCVYGERGYIKISIPSAQCYCEEQKSWSQHIHIHTHTCKAIINFCFVPTKVVDEGTVIKLSFRETN